MKHSEIIEKWRSSRQQIITTQRNNEYTMHLSVSDMWLTTVYLKRESK